MNSQRAKGLLLAALMFVASGLAVALRPTARLADQGPTISLETMVPTEIGQWRVDSGVVPLAPNPQQQALLNKLYNQTLSRTYIDPKGYRVMLSIAYGGDQSDAMHLVALVQQELGQIGAVLAGNAGDECDFGHC